jgi:hypothetical protein
MGDTRETAMIHWSCRVCGISTTCVHNAVADLAWHDHMANHADPDLFDAWTWTAVSFSWP